MKKIFNAFLALAMVITAGMTLTSCSKEDNSLPDNTTSDIERQRLEEWKPCNKLTYISGIESENPDLQAVIRQHLESGADAVGMVLTPGFRRSVPLSRAARMASMVPEGILAVGVFVDTPAEEVALVARSLGLGAVQLHGSEDEAYLSRLRELSDVMTIKSFIVGSADDIRKAEASSADLVLLDSGRGSGRALDWSKIGQLGRRTVLAGGLTPGNVGEAVIKVHPYAVDVSSGIETDGVKDADKMKAFRENVERADREA